MPKTVCSAAFYCHDSNRLADRHSYIKYLEIAKTLNIPDKTADKQMEKYLQTNRIERISHGNYQKR